MSLPLASPRPCSLGMCRRPCNVVVTPTTAHVQLVHCIVLCARVYRNILSVMCVFCGSMKASDYEENTAAVPFPMSDQSSHVSDRGMYFHTLCSMYSVDINPCTATPTCHGLRLIPPRVLTNALPNVGKTVMVAKTAALRALGAMSPPVSLIPVLIPFLIDTREHADWFWEPGETP
jgi:hypothetical protein